MYPFCLILAYFDHMVRLKIQEGSWHVASLIVELEAAVMIVTTPLEVEETDSSPLMVNKLEFFLLDNFSFSFVGCCLVISKLVAGC